MPIKQGVGDGHALWSLALNIYYSEVHMSMKYIPQQFIAHRKINLRKHRSLDESCWRYSPFHYRHTERLYKHWRAPTVTPRPLTPKYDTA
jgi:hypothetical protein